MITRRGLVRIRRFARGFVANPIETTLVVPEVIAARHDYRPDYHPDLDWEARLHGWLDAPYPCGAQKRMHRIWYDLVAELQSKGLPLGRFTYGEYSDAEINLAKAVWCCCIHKKPDVVIETGVAHGVTSRLILESFVLNWRGHLWSIDLPHPFDLSVHKQIGAAVSSSYQRMHWTYIKGSSRRRLSRLLRSLDPVDVFIHDSLHTARNTRFEMEQVLPHMRSGGVMIIDDIAQHQAFQEFADDHPDLGTMVCPHSDLADSYFGVVRVP